MWAIVLWFCKWTILLVNPMTLISGNDIVNNYFCHRSLNSRYIVASLPRNSSYIVFKSHFIVLNQCAFNNVVVGALYLRISGMVTIGLTLLIGLLDEDWLRANRLQWSANFHWSKNYWTCKWSCKPWNQMDFWCRPGNPVSVVFVNPWNQWV